MRRSKFRLIWNHELIWNQFTASDEFNEKKKKKHIYISIYILRIHIIYLVGHSFTCNYTIKLDVSLSCSFKTPLLPSHPYLFRERRIKEGKKENSTNHPPPPRGLNTTTKNPFPIETHATSEFERINVKKTGMANLSRKFHLTPASLAANFRI